MYDWFLFPFLGKLNKKEHAADDLNEGMGRGCDHVMNCTSWTICLKKNSKKLWDGINHLREFGFLVR